MPGATEEHFEGDFSLQLRATLPAGEVLRIQNPEDFADTSGRSLQGLWGTITFAPPTAAACRSPTVAARVPWELLGTKCNPGCSEEGIP